MRYSLASFLVLLFLTSSVDTVAAAETKAVQTMAGILLKLNHFPSDGDKEALKGIVENEETSEHERVVAQALINLEHKVSADGKPKLEALLKDESASESVKTLAMVLVNLAHTPTEADKEKLQKLVP
ncbi:MAG: hypothetical protein GEV06_13815 [Luteitalea sp.]|nr:hypothetical protein [Luteitalea sp.]